MFVSFFCGSVWLMNVSLSMSSFRYKMLSQTTPLSGIVMHVNESTQPDSSLPVMFHDCSWITDPYPDHPGLFPR